jgi:small-conductance mechanosensitive channel
MDAVLIFSHYPVAASLLVIIVLAAVLVLPAHWPLWLQIPTWAVALTVATLIAHTVIGSPLAPHFNPNDPGAQIWQRMIEAAWWLIAARVAVAIGKMLVVLENRPRETRIISDLVAGAIYIATVLAIINFSFEVPIRGLLATSGVIAIVLGLALQSTLSDVFSGIAVGLERPYKPGDLIWVEGNIEGRVSQLNWRSTHIATDHDNIAIVPNSVMAKARLINRSAPTPVRGDTITLDLNPAVAPEKCMSVLEAALRACTIPLPAPPATITCNGIAGDGARYEIEFSVPSGMLSSARSEIFTHVHRHLRHAGIALAVKGLASLPPVSAPTPQELLAESDLFGVMAAAERDFLAQHLSPLWLQPEDVLIQEGHPAQAIYVIGNGTAELTRAGAGQPQVLRRLNPGDSFGIIGLVTGGPSAITVTALTPMRVYRLEKADIAAAVKARPELAAELEAMAERGKAILSQFVVEHEEAHRGKPEVFLVKLRSFLHLLNV